MEFVGSIGLSSFGAISCSIHRNTMQSYSMTAVTIMNSYHYLRSLRLQEKCDKRRRLISTLRMSRNNLRVIRGLTSNYGVTHNRSLL